ncbi:uncharacterized protein LOC104887202 [Beta vulgaris subsp. vulgaris]|uniref:uncharacterized protein LOC104887202 n=1 Tax=Beta vulgaris subsp. vulgaris TaxID=3555 RepID=UPI002036F637|nr:uncharacterized protein LOC104887202 [Beta vulgaris subsp. vulgaris]
MIVLSWNIRGLGASIKRSSLRKLIHTHDPDLTLIQESKLKSINPKTIKSLWKDDSFEWFSCPSQGSSGGLISIWKNSFFSFVSVNCDKNWIAISGVIPSLNLHCCIINLYNPCCPEARSLVWDDLSQLFFSLQLPCLIVGDFNDILDSSERGSNMIHTNSSNAFKLFVQVLQLIEIPTSNGHFTWYRGQSKSKLYRVFVTHHWLSALPSLRTTLLQRSLSDHCPLLIQSKQRNWGPRPFRFINGWLSHPGFEVNSKNMG